MAPKIKNHRLKSGHKSKTLNPESETDFLEATEELEQAGVSDEKSTFCTVQWARLPQEIRPPGHAVERPDIDDMELSISRIRACPSTGYLLLHYVSLNV